MIKSSIRILCGAACAAASAMATTEPSYLLAAPGADFNFDAILTVGDLVPLTGSLTNQKYAMAGIPDAMGAFRDPISGEVVLFCAHEFPSGVSTAPVFGQNPQLAGAYVSRFTLDNSGEVISGSVAHQNLYSNNTLISTRPPTVGDSENANGFNLNAGFTRFCSGWYGGPADGLDRAMFFTNEESAGGNINANGSQAVVVVDGHLHTLPDLGRVIRENTVMMPRRDAYTAIIMTEDGPTATGTASYMYMYVGTKQRRSEDVLAKNGLVGGEIYVLAPVAAGAANEGTFTGDPDGTGGTLATKWVKITNGKNLTADQLSAAAVAANAFGFVRLEDCEFDPANPTRGAFVATTGGSVPNRLGRLYKLNFNPTNPTANGNLEMIYNADKIVAPNGTLANNWDLSGGIDYPLSIDNIAVTKDYIVICEDRNAPADTVFAKYSRTAGVWTLDRNANYAAKLQATFNYAHVIARDARPANAFAAGTWEASGVIDASQWYGANSFIINVQAHSSDRTNCEDPNNVNGDGELTGAQADDFYNEDGQILIMKLNPTQS